MRNMVKAQASVELIAVLGIALFVLLVYAVLSADLLSGIGSQKRMIEARDGVQRLVYAADSVYAQGEGASATVKVTIPPGASLNPENSYIGKPPSAPAAVPSNTVNLELDGTDVYASSRAPLAGAFPQSAGTYLMDVVSKGNYVAIGRHFFTLDKQAIFESMAKNETRQSVLTFSSEESGPVSVNFSYAQPYSNAGISLSQSSFLLTPENPSVGVVVELSSGQNAGGLYNWQLIITASSQESGASGRIDLPISMEVR